MKKAINIEAQSITFTFADGLAPITLRVADVSPEVATYAMLHGFAQRLGDNAAIARKDKDGNVVTVTEEMRWNAVNELRDHYASGTKEWNTRASAAPKQDATVAALAAKAGMTYEAFLAKISADIEADLTKE